MKIYPAHVTIPFIPSNIQFIVINKQAKCLLEAQKKKVLICKLQGIKKPSVT